jgi:hypothetical protein
MDAWFGSSSVPGNVHALTQLLFSSVVSFSARRCARAAQWQKCAAADMSSAITAAVVTDHSQFHHDNPVKTAIKYLKKPRSQELLLRAVTLISIYLLAVCIRLVSCSMQLEFWTGYGGARGLSARAGMPGRSRSADTQLGNGPGSAPTWRVHCWMLSSRNVHVSGDAGRMELTVCTHLVHTVHACATCVSTRSQFSVLRYESVIHEFDPHFK